MLLIAAQVILLGTGTPNADPDRSGPSVAIVANGTNLISSISAPEWCAAQLPRKSNHPI